LCRGRGRRGRGGRGKGGKQQPQTTATPQTQLNPHEFFALMKSIDGWVRHHFSTHSNLKSLVLRFLMWMLMILLFSCSQIGKIILREVQVTQSNFFSILFFFLECVELWFFNSRLLDSEQQIVDDLGELFETLIDTIPHLLNIDPLGHYTPKSVFFSLSLSLSYLFCFHVLFIYSLFS
jgi:hypothetical protein